MNWADRFEQMFRQFGHYFNVSRPERSSAGDAAGGDRVHVADRLFALRHRRRISAGLRSAGLLLNAHQPRGDVRRGRIAIAGARGDWRQSAAMLVHEAAHQAAFNTGIHSRLTSPPQWLAEGLATLFEARGVWNSDQYRRLSDRVNPGRLAEFRQFASGHTFARLDSEAGRFRSAVQAGYVIGVCTKLGADILFERARAGGI